MIDLRSQKSYDCNDLRKIVHILRSPGGCQWDQAQTHQSIRRNFLEEAYGWRRRLTKATWTI